uniref:Maf-like protein n=1 Tax=Aegilops tauschii subsp. strangulata TaxID=200361 RepID=A0A453H902_AEGTS
SSNNSPSFKFKIILGSSSPARRAILSDMGYEFATMSADIDERAIRREKPEELVKALAEAKADAIKLNLVDGCADRDIRDPPTLLITSDQVVVSKGVIRERPRSMEEAREFIKAYSGDRALAVNYVLLTNLSTGATKGGWDIPEICFHHIPVEFIEEVVKEGDMTCVAGGLKLTHPSVLPFIKELVGTADGVRGLPRELTEKLIRESLEVNS